VDLCLYKVKFLCVLPFSRRIINGGHPEFFNIAEVMTTTQAFFLTTPSEVKYASGKLLFPKQILKVKIPQVEARQKLDHEEVANFVRLSLK
jgi:hypothetical protein